MKYKIIKWPNDDIKMVKKWKSVTDAKYNFSIKVSVTWLE